MGFPMRVLRPRARVLAVLAAACALALVAAPAALAAQACPSASAHPAQVGQRVMVRATLCLLNAERATHGLRPLSLDRRLSKAAGGHADDMARHNYFSHDSPNGGTFVDRIRRVGYLRGAKRWAVGENIAWGSRNRATPRSIIEAWMESSGHRANILSGSYREIGIGVARGAPVAGGAESAATYATDFGMRR